MSSISLHKVLQQVFEIAYSKVAPKTSSRIALRILQWLLQNFISRAFKILSNSVTGITLSSAQKSSSVPQKGLLQRWLKYSAQLLQYTFKTVSRECLQKVLNPCSELVSMRNKIWSNKPKFASQKKWVMFKNCLCTETQTRLKSEGYLTYKTELFL